MKERAKQLVNDHWDGYNGPLLEAAGITGDTLKLCEYIYKSSGRHFYGHAVEDERDKSRAAFANETAAEITIKTVEEARKGAGKSPLVFGGTFAPHKDEPQAPDVPFVFPACQRFMGALPGEVVKKLREETNEVEEAYKLPYTTDLLMELYDVVHVAETAIRGICEKARIDPLTVKAQVIQKNQRRNYYEPCECNPPPPSIMDCAGIRCDQCEEAPC